jgi:hypothetical protein
VLGGHLITKKFSRANPSQNNTIKQTPKVKDRTFIKGLDLAGEVSNA